MTRVERFWEDFDPRNSTVRRDGGPDLSCLADMKDEERRSIEAGLLQRLEARPRSDDMVVKALGELRSEAAVPMLRKLASGRGHGSLRVAAAAALWKIRAEPGMVATIIQILKGRPSFWARLGWGFLDYARIDAVMALGSIDTLDSRKALEEALADRNSNVGHAAKVALHVLKNGRFDLPGFLREEGWTGPKRRE